MESAVTLWSTGQRTRMVCLGMSPEVASAEADHKQEMAFSPGHGRRPTLKPRVTVRHQSPGGQWHSQLCGALSFPPRELWTTKPFIPERLSIMAGFLGVTMSPSPYQSLSVAWLSWKSRPLMSISPRHMEVSER